MEAFEILTSESQERMLAIVAPDRLADVRAVCERWGLASAVIATLVPGGMLTIRHGGDVVAQVPASSLADDGPEYERPMAPDDVAETARGSRVHAVRGRPARGARRRALLAEHRQQALGVRAVRLARPGADRRVGRLRRRRRPRPGHAQGLGAVERRQGPVRPSRSVPGRGARRRRGRAERRGHRSQTARDHELHELRQPRATGRDVAVRRGDPRDARRVPGVRHAGDRRQRQLLQRVG